MLATQIRQKDSVFYFCAYPADDILDKVRFISRFYAEGAPSLAGEEIEDTDEVAQFISKIEASDAGVAHPSPFSSGRMRGMFSMKPPPVR